MSVVVAEAPPMIRRERMFGQMGAVMGRDAAEASHDEGAHGNAARRHVGSSQRSASPYMTNPSPVAASQRSRPPPAVHVRSYFPEALYINPEIITDRNGDASITIPLADSITTWRMAMMASTTHGALGSGDVQPQSLPGFLRRPRPARHAHPGRPRLDSGGGLQLLRRARRCQPGTAAGRLVRAGG